MTVALRNQQGVQEILDDVRHSLPDLSGFPPDVRCVLHEVHLGFSDPRVNVEFIRDRCRAANHNLSSRFTLRVGVGIRDYIERLRLGAACQLLLRTSLRAYEVAEVVGYTYVETFERAFSRQVGVPPAAYRRTGWEIRNEGDAGTGV